MFGAMSSKNWPDTVGLEDHPRKILLLSTASPQCRVLSAFRRNTKSYLAIYEAIFARKCPVKHQSPWRKLTFSFVSMSIFNFGLLWNIYVLLENSDGLLPSQESARSKSL